MFHKLPHYFKANDTQASIDREEAIDMSKVSDAVLNATIHRFQVMHESATGSNASMIEDVKEQMINETRTEKLSKNRRFLPWHGSDDVGWDWAANYMARQKIFDCMLTLIYMARHHLKAMSSMSNRRDSTYRMAYLWSKLQALSSKIKFVYNAMKRKANITSKDLKKKKYLVTLYRQALKLHTKFNFYYFMMSRMHHNLVDELRSTTVPANTKNTKTKFSKNKKYI